jgi:hypothetical protein
VGIQPEGDAVRNAVKYISELRKESSEFEMKKLIEQACLKFDLTPKDANFLTQFYKEQEK